MIVELRLAVPERLGSEVMVGGWLVTVAAAAHREVDPTELVFVVLTVMNLFASSATCL